jgi:hypothetical protein
MDVATRGRTSSIDVAPDPPTLQACISTLVVPIARTCTAVVTNQEVTCSSRRFPNKIVVQLAIFKPAKVPASAVYGLEHRGGECFCTPHPMIEETLQYTYCSSVRHVGIIEVNNARVQMVARSNRSKPFADMQEQGGCSKQASKRGAQSVTKCTKSSLPTEASARSRSSCLSIQPAKCQSTSLAPPAQRPPCCSCSQCKRVGVP